jgi:flagellar biosynthesis protein FlhG
MSDNAITSIISRILGKVLPEAPSYTASVEDVEAVSMSGVSERLRRRVVAIGSGKGGVGKSTTSVNLAVIAAKLGRRVGLIDLDPLSNMATILDIPKERLEQVSEKIEHDHTDLDDQRLHLYPNIDLLFPRPKLSRSESTQLRAALFDSHADELVSRYDLLILDMPAGIGREENLAFLKFVGVLVVVTNPEPTSHVSAGGYIRVALELIPDLPILFWHNRYRPVLAGGFHPTDVVANYNRYVDEELQIGEQSRAQMRTVATIPDDPALNLLQQSLSIEAHVLGKLLDATGMLHRAVIAGISADGILTDDAADEVRYHLSSHSGVVDAAELSSDISEAVRATSTLPSEVIELDAGGVNAFVERYGRHPLVRLIREVDILLRDSTERVIEEDRPFADNRGADRAVQSATRSITTLIHAIARRRSPDFERNLGGILVCYLSLLLITRSEQVRRLVLSVIPRRVEEGRTIRDRRAQIGNLVSRSDDYHKRYFQLVRRLYPVLVSQVSKLVARHGWQTLLLKDQEGNVNKNAYLKLLTHVLHDSLHSGLGVYVGFRFNAAGKAIEDGARTLLKSLRI